ncbi:hypothetical protein SYNPS1DRAFT_14030, partial [Syncephalis pseudoplumigaleata]
MPTLNRPRKVGGPSLGCRVNATLSLVPGTATPPTSLAVYAYGGFHQYSDEVYGDLNRVALGALHWEPLADITMDSELPARYDHSTVLWRDRVLVVFGGHDVDGHALADVILIDLHSAHAGGDRAVRWRFARCHGVPPKGRAKHAAAIIDDMLYVSGGYDRVDGSVVVFDDLCRLNLLTGEWLEPVPFTSRYSHQLLVCGDGRLLAYGGYNAEMEPLSELAFFNPSLSATAAAAAAAAAAATSTLASGDMHFAGIFGDRLVVLVTRCVSSGHSDLVGLWSMDLPRLVWRRHAEADELAEQLAAGSWHYCVPSREGDRWWLFGAAENTDAEEYLGTVVELDLREHGVLPMPPSDIGDNLIRYRRRRRRRKRTGGSGGDTAMEGQTVSFRVHRCIIASRWPHFANMLASDTLESTR